MYLSPKGLGKTFNDFSNDTLLIDTGIVNSFAYIRGNWFIHKNAKLQSPPWNMMTSSKKSCDLD